MQLKTFSKMLTTALLSLPMIFTTGCDVVAERQMSEIERQVAEDAVKQYEIAKRSGSAMDAYIRAGLAAEAFLLAKDEENFKKWTDIRKSEGKRAGLPD